MAVARFGSRKKYRGVRHRKSGSYTKGFLVFGLIGIFMYVFIAGATGKWAADHIVMPVLSLFSGEMGTSAPSSTASDAQNQNDTTAVSETIKVESISYYILQLGAFSQSTNAESEAKNAQGRGAAGYIMEGDGYFRVMASAYGNVDDIKTVQDRLKEEDNVESGSFHLESRELELKVSGTNTQLQALKDSFDAIKSLRTTLDTLIEEYDNQNITQNNCTEQIKSETRKLQTAIENMEETAKNNSVAALLVELMKQLNDQMNTMEAKDTVAQFSSQLKYSQIYALDVYNKFITKLSEQ